MDTSTEVLVTVGTARAEESAVAEALRGRGVQVRVVTPPETADYFNGFRAPPRAVVVGNVLVRPAADMARRFRCLGVPTVNTVDAIEVCADKGHQALLFKSAGIPHPVTRVAYTLDQVSKWAAEVGWPVVVKPSVGSQGRGVSRLDGPAALDAWWGGMQTGDPFARSFPVVIQGFLNKPGYDLRVVVVGTQPLVAIRRYSADWRTNTHLGASVERIDVDSTLRRLVADVVTVIGPGFYGIDAIALAGDLQGVAAQPVLLEVNAAPEFVRSARWHGVDIASAMADYVLSLC